MQWQGLSWYSTAYLSVAGMIQQGWGEDCAHRWHHLPQRPPQGTPADSMWAGQEAFMGQTWVRCVSFLPLTRAWLGTSCKGCWEHALAVSQKNRKWFWWAPLGLFHSPSFRRCRGSCRCPLKAHRWSSHRVRGIAGVQGHRQPSHSLNSQEGKWWSWPWRPLLCLSQVTNRVDPADRPSHPRGLSELRLSLSSGLSAAVGEGLGDSRERPLATVVSHAFESHCSWSCFC